MVPYHYILYILTNISRLLGDIFFILQYQNSHKAVFFHYTIKNPMMMMIYRPGHEKTCLRVYVDYEGTDQPEHVCNLISALAVPVRNHWA